MPIRIRKRMEPFAAAHQNPGFGVDEKCARMHGHNYQVDIVVEGELDDFSNAIIDFGIIKQIYKERVKNKLDHNYIIGSNVPKWLQWLHKEHNITFDDLESHGFGNIVIMASIKETSLENIAIWIHRHMQQGLREAGFLYIDVVEVRVEETPTSIAEYVMPGRGIKKEGQDD